MSEDFDIYGTSDLLVHFSAEHQLEFMRAVLNASADAIIVHEPDGRLIFFNDAALDLLGLTPTEMEVIEPYGWVGPTSQLGAANRLESILHDGVHRFFSTTVDGSGTTIPTEVSASRFDGGRGPLIVAVIRDISERASAQEQLEYLAHHDALTGLANRSALDEHLNRAIGDSRRHGDLLVLAYVDLDRFKPLNDQYGHEVGDQVLVEIAQRLSSHVREGDVCARLGGDEFVILLRRLRSANEIGGIAERILDSLREPIALDPMTVSIDASIGFAVFDPAEDDARSLVVKGDVAMYASKRDESRSWLLYSEEMGPTRPHGATPLPDAEAS